VIILTKEKVENANSTWAQGGISAVFSTEDSFQSHIQDTLIAGAGLCNEDAVKNIVTQAPDRIKDLINWGVKFDHKKTSHGDHFEMDLTKEGGHSFRRILHFEDQTGKHIHRKLLERVRQTPNIKILENTFAIDLILNKQLNVWNMNASECLGLYALNNQTGLVDSYLASQIILATGGSGKVYKYTTNWSGCTGDGIAMAYRAGARLANLEFMQFHPTCLYHKDSRNFLISEALRGEGGELIDSAGNAFMKKYHHLGSLAPRDIVARSIDAEMKKSGAPCVFLDMTHLDAEYLKTRFPSIYQKCLEFQIDLTTTPIPVVPAAHYLCGGVVTDVAGRTDIQRLWAIGETACTGLHGANRLASNSLLECVAMAENLFQELKTGKLKTSFETPNPWFYPQKTDDDEMIVIHHMWNEIREIMWNYVGIVRSNKRLHRAQSRLKNIMTEVKDYYSNFKIHKDIIELRNIATVAEAIVECAIKREDSIGIHYNLDNPTSNIKQGVEPKNSVVYRKY
jgi:L-aspartate oxidase